MENTPAILPSNDAGDGDSSTSTSASSLSSIDAIKDSATAPSLNNCDGKPPSNYARDDDAIKGSTAAPSLTDYDDDEDVCRICRNPGDTENPLRFPCACRGSIKYVHQNCLLQWLNHSNAHQCEVCKHDFAFSPVYAENAPTKLPFHEFIVAMAKKTSPIMQFILRLSFVLSVWLLIIPYTIYLIYRLAFVKSFGEVPRLFLSHIFTTNILTDCLSGFLVCASLTCIYHVATLLRNFFRNLLEQLRGRDVQGNRNLDGDENVQGIARIEALINKMLDHELVGMQGRNGHLVKNQMIQRIYSETCQMIQRIEHMVDELDDNGAEENQMNQVIAHHQAEIREMIQKTKQMLQTITKFANDVAFYELAGRNFRSIAHFLAQMMQIVQRDADIQAQIRLNRARNAQNVPLSELLGLQGQLWPFALFAFTVLVRNIYALGGVIFMPLCLGRVILHYMFSKESSNLATLGVGYMAIISLFFLYLVILELIRYKRGESLIIGQFNFPSLLRHLKTMLKVCLFLVIIIFTQYADVMLGTKIKTLLRYWLNIVGTALGLTHILLQRPEANGAHQRQDRDFVVLQILAWITLFVSDTVLIILPVSLERSIFTAISPFPKMNGIKFDLSTFIIGIYVIGGLVALIALIWDIAAEIDHIRIRRVNVSWMNIRKWSVIVLMICALLFVLSLGFEIVINSVVFQFALLGCLGLGLVWYCVKGFRVWFTYLHNSIRDERYLIGRTLRNFGEDKEV